MSAALNGSNDAFLDDLKLVYQARHQEAEFEAERSIYSRILPELNSKLAAAGYQLKKPFGLGSTATIWHIDEQGLGRRRALKIARPNLSKLKDIVKLIGDEGKNVASLNHPNIVKVYFTDDLTLAINGDDYDFPYFVMDYLEEVQDLDQYLLAHRESLGADGIIGCFRDVVVGLAYLHNARIIHCDLKPANVFVAKGPQVVIADLGYAKHVGRYSNSTELTKVTYTQWFAHPELERRIVNASESAAIRAEVPRGNLREAFDLFALGRSIQQILYKLRCEESESPGINSRQSIFSPYQWLYLGFIAKRLLDGQHKTATPQIPDEEDLGSSTIRGVPKRTMNDIRYATAEDAQEDLEKLLHLYDLEGLVPELNPSITKYIQIPATKVPLTDRVEKIINHPSFRRLSHVSQLGFVSLVYPGATHSRFEHAMGTFAMASATLRAMWYDQTNPFFQCVMSQHDLESGLLASLFHDIGQYSMAHDLTEVETRFAHETFTQAMFNQPDSRGRLLENILRSDWDCSFDEIVAILDATDKSPFKIRILRALINSPLDADKLDYLQRDSIHLGVSFGSALDIERLLRNFTLVYHPKNPVYAPTDDFPLAVNIGILSKALPIAKAVLTARADMFRQVYWHHSVRAMKAMLAYSVRRIMIGLKTEEDELLFWNAFKEFVLTGKGGVALAEVGVEKSDGGDPAMLFGDDVATIPEFAATQGADDAILRFLWSFADENGKNVLDAIRKRKIYRRLAVLSADVERQRYESVYNAFRTYRLDRDHKKLEEQRQEWELSIRQMLEDRCRKNPGPACAYLGTDDVEIAIKQLRATVPLILVDVPIKATARAPEEKGTLWYLEERIHSGGGSAKDFLLDFKRATVDLGQKEFDLDVGKIRVFVAPGWRDLFTFFLSADEVMATVTT